MTTEISKHDVDLAFYQALELLRLMIQTPSVSRDEAAVADRIEAWAKQYGVSPRRVGNNLIFEPDRPDPAKPNLLLNSHIDTVRPAASWTRDPFAPTEDDEGRLYGLGSNDAGAPLVSLLLTWLMLRDTEQPYNLYMVASAEEEVSGAGGIASVLPELPEFAFAVVGEPTQMQPAVAEKGLMVVDGTVAGKAGHAARNEGINAIYRALPVVEALRDMQFPLVSPHLGPVKVSVTQINAGTAHNVVPDRCTFVVDVRTNECYSNEAAFQLLQAAVGEGAELKARSFRLNSSSVSEEHPFVVRAKMMGKEPFGSPTLSDQALLRCPSVKIGPGDSARSHTADEYIRLDELRAGIAEYVRLLDGLRIH
jgi:acetylornithine deacetylase